MNRSRGYDSLMNSTFFVAFASALLTNLFLHYIVDLNVNWFLNTLVFIFFFLVFFFVIKYIYVTYFTKDRRK